MKRIDLAYTAGIFDGEGCICLTRRKTKKLGHRDRFGLLVSISSTNEWLCQWLRFTWGGSVSILARQSPKHKPAWRWHIVANMALNFLESIRPYLHLKAAEAELAITFQNRRKALGSRVRLNPNIILEEAESLLMKTLKAKP